MKLSFDDEESLKETVESLCFNNPPSDPNTPQQMGSMVPQEAKRNHLEKPKWYFLHYFTLLFYKKNGKNAIWNK